MWLNGYWKVSIFLRALLCCPTDSEIVRGIYPYVIFPFPILIFKYPELCGFLKKNIIDIWKEKTQENNCYKTEKSNTCKIKHIAPPR